MASQRRQPPTKGVYPNEQTVQGARGEEMRQGNRIEDEANQGQDKNMNRVEDEANQGQDRSMNRSKDIVKPSGSQQIQALNDSLNRETAAKLLTDPEDLNNLLAQLSECMKQQSKLRARFDKNTTHADSDMEEINSLTCQVYVVIKECDRAYRQMVEDAYEVLIYYEELRDREKAKFSLENQMNVQDRILKTIDRNKLSSDRDSANQNASLDRIRNEVEGLRLSGTREAEANIEKKRLLIENTEMQRNIDRLSNENANLKQIIEELTNETTEREQRVEFSTQEKATVAEEMASEINELDQRIESLEKAQRLSKRTTLTEQPTSNDRNVREANQGRTNELTRQYQNRLRGVSDRRSTGYGPETGSQTFPSLSSDHTWTNASIRNQSTPDNSTSYRLDEVSPTVGQRSRELSYQHHGGPSDEVFSQSPIIVGSNTTREPLSFSTDSRNRGSVDLPTSSDQASAERQPGPASQSNKRKSDPKNRTPTRIPGLPRRGSSYVLGISPTPKRPRSSLPSRPDNQLTMTPMNPQPSSHIPSSDTAGSSFASSSSNANLFTSVSSPPTRVVSTEPSVVPSQSPITTDTAQNTQTTTFSQVSMSTTIAHKSY